MRRAFVIAALRRRTLRTRLLRAAAALIGLGLLLLAVVSSVASGHTSLQAELDYGLQGQATAATNALTDYFERARTVDLLLADNTALQPLSPGGQPRSSKHFRASGEASDALKYLETLYPDAVSEACLIDLTGSEVARVVRGDIAPVSELSSDEASSPFYGPTMRLASGRVYQAKPYLSPDTGLWVISNSTPITGLRGTTWGIVHFEVALESFRAVLRPAGRSGASAAIVDDRTGRIILETGQPLSFNLLGRASSPALTRLVSSSPTSGTSATIDGRRVAVAHVPAQPDNANSWSVVVSAPASAAGWSRSLGPTPVAISLAALALLAFAGLTLRASHREMQKASVTDELTGLPNRRLLTDRLRQTLLLARRREMTSAVLLIDLDRFKEVNDTLGHHYGDVLLVEVASRLEHAVRLSDTVARLGGDEFAVLLPDITDEDAALVFAARCLARLHQPFTIEGLNVSVEASIGVALAPHHGLDDNTLLRAADVAMYEAKERRCGIVVYDSGHDVHTPTRLALLGDLRRALQHDELVMYYQPKVDVGTGKVSSAEALVRWQHPERGLLAPDEFIPVAESTGLILPLTLHTLDLAIRQAKRWDESSVPVQVAVNLSPRCLLEADLPAKVQAILRQHGLSAHLLRLEVTETSIMADPARAITILTALQQAGVSLSLDDFGTGYSSMSYLKRLPVDELKIDRSFVTDMLTAGNDSVLVRSSIDLGHNLGLSVVAEGVEDSATMDRLAGLGCDVVQGYHLARPMPPEALMKWLTTRQENAVPAPVCTRRPGTTDHSPVA